MKKPIYPLLLTLLAPVGFAVGAFVWTSDVRSYPLLLIAVFGVQLTIAVPLLWFAPQLKAGGFSAALGRNPGDYIVPDHGVRLITTILLGLGIGTLASSFYGGIYSLVVGLLQCFAGGLSLVASRRRR